MMVAVRIPNDEQGVGKARGREGERAIGREGERKNMKNKAEKCPRKKIS